MKNSCLRLFWWIFKCYQASCVSEIFQRKKIVVKIDDSQKKVETSQYISAHTRFSHVFLTFEIEQIESVNLYTCMNNHKKKHAWVMNFSTIHDAVFDRVHAKKRLESNAIKARILRERKGWIAMFLYKSGFRAWSHWKLLLAFIS